MPSVAEDSIHMSKCNETVWMNSWKLQYFRSRCVEAAVNIHLGQFSCCLTWSLTKTNEINLVPCWMVLLICTFRMFVVKWRFRFNANPWANCLFPLCPRRSPSGWSRTASLCWSQLVTRFVRERWSSCAPISDAWTHYTLRRGTGGGPWSSSMRRAMGRTLRASPWRPSLTVL